jgi:hypothetical protein
MLKAMTRLLAAIAILFPLTAALADTADSPTLLGANNGKFGTWTAVESGTGSDRICYAFTSPQSSSPDWKGRGLVMLTVTEHQGVRDVVSITPGYTYPKNSTVSVTLGTDTVAFYALDNVALTQNETAALIGLDRQNVALVTSTGPDGQPVVDKYALEGFAAAYRAITEACP